MLTAEPHHIIAIGASAGGLDELNRFFDHTPSDGVSYVIVQHLSAEFKSHMVALLSRHSKLVVQEAEDGMSIQENHWKPTMHRKVTPPSHLTTMRERMKCSTTSTP